MREQNVEQEIKQIKCIVYSSFIKPIIFGF